MNNIKIKFIILTLMGFSYLLLRAQDSSANIDVRSNISLINENFQNIQSNLEEIKNVMQSFQEDDLLKLDNDKLVTVKKSFEKINEDLAIALTNAKEILK